MKKLFYILLSAMVVASCSSGRPEENTTLLRLKKAFEEGKYMYAHQDDLCYGHFWHDSLGLSDVKLVCGDYPAIVGFDLGGLEMGDSANLDSVDFNYMRLAVQQHADRGGIVTFSWHPRNPLTGGDAWDVSGGDVVSAILPGGELNSKYMGWLSSLADFLDSLKDSDGKPVEAIFRPYHENFGGWFWWGVPFCGTDKYKDLWTMTYEYMVEERGLKSLVWAYSPNSDVSSDEYMSAWPGDSMVDIMGLDAYQSSTSEAYIDLVDSCLSYIENLAAEHGKLFALTETGWEGIPDPLWWTETLIKAISNHKPTYVLTWRNAWDRPGHFYGPWPGALCEDDFRAFYALPSTLFLEDIDSRQICEPFTELNRGL